MNPFNTKYDKIKVSVSHNNAIYVYKLIPEGFNKIMIAVCKVKDITNCKWYPANVTWWTKKNQNIISTKNFTDALIYALELAESLDNKFVEVE